MKKIIFLFLIFLLSKEAAAASPEDLKKAEALNESAVVKLKALDFDGAEIDLLSALEYANQNPKLRKNLGVVYYEKGIKALRSGNFFDAQKNLKAAREIEPDSIRYTKALSNAFLIEATARAKNGQNDAAFLLCQKAAEMDATNLQARTQAAYYAWLLQRLDDAQKYLDEAKALDAHDKNVLSLEEKLKKSSPEENHEQLESEHFILSADPEYLNKINTGELLQELESVYAELSYTLNFSPKNKISVVFYPIKEFHDHWKLPSRVNAFYDGKLRIPYTNEKTPISALRQMLQHELLHAFMSFLSEKPGPRWLNEGLAQWAEKRKIDPKAKDALVIYQITKRLPDIEHLDSVFTAQRNPYNNTEATLVYMKSLSLAEYLIETNGIWNVIQFMKEGGEEEAREAIFQKYFGGSTKEIEEKWTRWVERKKSNLLVF